MLNRHARISAIAALTLLAGGCRHSAAQPELIPPEERFAREFIRVLQDSGAAAVLPLATTELRARQNFARNMDVLRGILGASHATLTLAHWNALPQTNGGPNVTHVVFTVQGVGAPSEIGLWIEGDSGHYLLNTIAIGSPNPGGAE
ncbi:MAG TPA: hypothetical protein DEV93_07895 [Chloroflexi bacterium]|nr:hypothetical protein [Chloroflexota bacterium]